MPSIGSASLEVIPSFKGLQGKLESGTGKAMTAAGVSGGNAFGDSAGRAAGSKFRSHVKNFAKIAAVGLGLATAAAIKFAGDSLEEAREAQKVGALTESTIKATGKAARVTAKHVGDLSGKISAKVGIDDEAIQSGANMLLTFKNIRNEAGEGNKIFDQTLTTLVDMSSAMGTDAKTSAIQLGKALNDPIKGVSALSRVGVTFTEDQKKAIAKMVEAGDVMGAQKVVLRELKSEFGGAAKAQATEADKLSVAWGNFKEEIGTQLLPVMDDLARFLRKKGIPAAKDFAGWVRDDMIPAVKNFADEVEPVVDGLKSVVKWVNKLPSEAKVAGLVTLFGAIAGSKLRGGNLGGGGVLGGIGKAVGLAKPVPVFVTNPGFGGGANGLPGKTGRLGKVAGAVGKYGGPAAVVAGAAVGLNEFHKWNHKGDTPLGYASGGKVGDFMRNLFSDDDAKEYEKNVGVVNNAWAKVGKTTDGAKEKVVLYDGTLRKLPTTWTTVFNSVNLARDTALIKQYGGMLDGLDGRTVTTFLKTVRTNNDTGESGDPRFGGFRAHGGSMSPGYSYMVGERGPEMVTVGARSTVTPTEGAGTTFVLMLDGEVLDHRIRQVSDDRYAANRRHPTGRR